jgi:rhamnogalacturonyl hydrolase YesR
LSFRAAAGPITRRGLLRGAASFALVPLRAAAGAEGGCREHALAAMDYIQRVFWDERASLYRPTAPPDPKALPYDFMWANGVQFSALAAAARAEPARYRPLLERFFRALDRYWDADAPIPGYDAYFASPDHDDKYYDDNAWMVLTFIEAYETTRDRRYLKRAEETMRFVLSGWDDLLGGGIYWRQDRKSKNTCSNGPSAAALLALARHGERKERVRWARRIVAWTNERLQAPDGAFWDNCDLEGKIERTKWTYNTALMLRSNLGLYRLTRETSFLREAERLADASVREFVHRETGAFRDDALFSHLLVEAFTDLYRETRAPALLEHARRNAEFLIRELRAPDGGYWTKWRRLPERREPRRTLMANAASARLLFLVDEAERLDPRRRGGYSESR